MSLPNGQNAWPPPAMHQANGARLFHHHVDDVPAGTLTPVDHSLVLMPEASEIEEDQRRAHFADLYRKSDAKLQVLFHTDGSYDWSAIRGLEERRVAALPALPPATDHTPTQEPPRKKLKRTIDEDDYDDDEDEDEEPAEALPHKPKTSAGGALLSPSKSGSSPVQSVTSPGKQAEKTKVGEGSQSGQPSKSSEDARKQLEEAKTATEEEVRRSFHTRFFTLEHDRTAMLEQQQLEESEKQLQAEMDNNGGNSNADGQGTNQGSLSSANLGASSLTLKHLIARIDMKRDQVQASDAELRLLMNEVRKNRSKWASEENVNQEELYEALEKVLTELKAHTEYSTPFLTRVNKRDAPDYYSFIKHPMDLGTMTKKLKGLNYKSKSEFVTDLNLIWDNCLKYNQDMNHPLRRMANGMRKEAEKLIPLIPDLAIRTRAEVEAEERRKQNGGDDDGGDDSDDEPIMSSRGRKAGVKGANKSRKTHGSEKEGTPSVDKKPHLQINGLLAKGREGSETVDSNGFATPPVAGSKTPSGINGHLGIGGPTDIMDIDGPSLNGMALNQALGEAAEQAYEDEEYKIWKQVTKKDRARVAKERFQLFKDNRLNVEAPAVLRTRAAIRRFLKAQKQYETGDGMGSTSQQDASATASKPQETLAEEMEEEEEIERVIPDYYEPQGIIPSILPTMQWVEDNEGQVINQHEESLQVVPKDHFKSPISRLTKNIDSNIQQIQETRKLATKIAVVKQMQIQTQVYANQFPRSNFEPFIEHDGEEHFISDGGPVMAPQTCHGALKRSVGKILYHAGFEELQPAALDTLTNIAGDYFEKLIRTFTTFNDAEKKVGTTGDARFQARFTPEEVLIHTLDENGCDIVALETHAKDEVGRLGTKLAGIHERMRMHLADLLRPALAADVGADGVGAFNDGSEQFVSGDFAEELGEDFFGFRNLGLERELGLDTLSVPLHLLQSRVRSQFQQTQAAGPSTEDLFEPLRQCDPVTKENIQNEIGLVKNFFLAKLHANGDQPLVEDQDLPVKQQRPRPRLPATGKIVAPPKRPPKEQIALARKKKKLEAQMAEAKMNPSPGKGGTGSQNTTPAKKLKSIPQLNGVAPNPAQIALGAPSMERSESMQSQGNASQTDRDEPNGMMSPESLGKLED